MSSARAVVKTTDTPMEMMVAATAATTSFTLFIDASGSSDSPSPQRRPPLFGSRAFSRCAGGRVALVAALAALMATTHQVAERGRRCALNGHTCPNGTVWSPSAAVGWTTWGQT